MHQGAAASQARSPCPAAQAAKRAYRALSFNGILQAPTHYNAGMLILARFSAVLNEILSAAALGYGDSLEIVPKLFST